MEENEKETRRRRRKGKQAKKIGEEEVKIEIRDLSSLSVLKSDGFMSRITAPQQGPVIWDWMPKKRGPD